MKVCFDDKEMYVNMSALNTLSTIRDFLVHLDRNHLDQYEAVFFESSGSFRLDQSLSVAFPLPQTFSFHLIKRQIPTVGISDNLNEVELDAYQDFSNVGLKLKNGIGGILKLFPKIRSDFYRNKLYKKFYSSIFVGCPSYSGKSQLAYTLDKDTKYPTKIAGMSPVLPPDDPKLACVLHFIMTGAQDATEGRSERLTNQPAYGYIKTLSDSFSKALHDDFNDLLPKEGKLNTSLMISHTNLTKESLKSSRYRILGITYRLLELRKEGYEFNYDDLHSEPCPDKSIEELAELVKKFDLPVVVVLDEFQPDRVKNSRHFDSLFMCRNLLQLAGCIVMIMGTYSKASDQVSSPATGDVSRAFDEPPWVYVVNKVPNASPETIDPSLVLHRIESPDGELTAMFAAFQTWDDLLIQLQCPESIRKWLLACTDAGDFAHCTRPGIVVIFLAELIKVLHGKTKPMEAVQILQSALMNTKSIIYREKTTLETSDVGRFYSYFTSYREPFDSDNKKEVPSKLINEHLSYLYDPLGKRLYGYFNEQEGTEGHADSERRKGSDGHDEGTNRHGVSNEPQYFELKRSIRDAGLVDAENRSYVPTGCYPPFQRDEVTNSILLLPGKNETFIPFKALSDAKLEDDGPRHLPTNKGQPRKPDGKDLEGLGMGALVKASLAGGLKGQTLADFLENYLADLGLPRKAIQQTEDIAALLDEMVPAFAPVDSEFSEEFKAINGVFLGKASSAVDATRFDGVAVGENSDVLFTFEYKEHEDPISFGDASDIVDNGVAYCNRHHPDSRLHVMMIVVHDISETCKTKFRPGTTVLRVESARDVYALNEIAAGAANSVAIIIPLRGLAARPKKRPAAKQTAGTEAKKHRGAKTRAATNLEDLK